MSDTKEKKREKRKKERKILINILASGIGQMKDEGNVDLRKDLICKEDFRHDTLEKIQAMSLERTRVDC